MPASSETCIPLTTHGELHPGQPALFVGHAGHELAIHGWLERTKPCVFVLTDGSGRGGESRLDYTSRLLRRCGAESSYPFGLFSDFAIYEAFLQGDHHLFLALIEPVAVSLIQQDVSYLICDPADGFNPGHDLCRLLSGAIVERVRQISGKVLPLYEYLLPATCHDPEGLGGPSWRQIELTPGEYDRKITASRTYLPLRNEVDLFLARRGESACRSEWFIRATDPWLLHHGFPFPPRYESHGKKMVAAGVYSAVLRYQSHFAPLVQAAQHQLGRRAA